MATSIANCKKCARVYQKVLSELCSDCIKLEEQQVQALYRALQKSASKNGIAIEVLSHEMEISIEDIERYYLEGRLGTAGVFLKFQCQGCGVMTGESQRKGRFCLDCSEKTASKARVEVKTRQSLERGEQEEKRRQEQLEILRKSKPAPHPSQAADDSRYGFTRTSR